MNSSTAQFIEKNKLIVICRGIYGDNLLNLSQALYEGGIRLIEVTFDQANPDCMEKTTQAISALKNKHQDAMLIGAGTVLSPLQVECAYNAGASYIISPNVNPAVIKKTKELELISIPGAMTPTEILYASELGADFVKLFPATTLGMRYIKDIRGPINHIKLVAAGGVTEENLPEYLNLHFAGAGISNRLTDPTLIAENNFAEFTRRAKVFVDIVKNKGVSKN